LIPLYQQTITKPGHKTPINPWDADRDRHRATRKVTLRGCLTRAAA